MDSFLETLKIRLADAQKRAQEAHQKMQVAQAEYQAVAQELASWQKAVEVETRREQASTPVVQVATVLIANETQLKTTTETSTPEVNKTETIRELLRQHPTGITPADLWKAVSSTFKHRPYLYSVLKRLKDRDEVTERRGKYVLKIVPKAEEAQAQLLQ